MEGGSGTESALIALGSNLGDRAGYLRRALERLAAAPGVSFRGMSSVRETAPVGRPGAGPLGGPYLNAVAEVLARIEPRALLEVCLQVEAELGRVRAGPDSPRTIDLDLLLHGDARIDEPDLTIPHRGLTERNFVLYPLRDIAPDLLLHGHGRIRELAARAGSDGLAILQE